MLLAILCEALVFVTAYLTRMKDWKEGINVKQQQCEGLINTGQIPLREIAARYLLIKAPCEISRMALLNEKLLAKVSV